MWIHGAMCAPFRNNLTYLLTFLMTLSFICLSFFNFLISVCLSTCLYCWRLLMTCSLFITKWPDQFDGFYFLCRTARTPSDFLSSDAIRVFLQCLPTYLLTYLFSGTLSTMILYICYVCFFFILTSKIFNDLLIGWFIFVIDTKFLPTPCIKKQAKLFML